MKIYAPTERAARCVKPHKSDAATDSAPSNSDAVAHRIIGEHFFGIEPFRPIGSVAAEIVADLKFRHQVLRRIASGHVQVEPPPLIQTKEVHHDR